MQERPGAFPTGRRVTKRALAGVLPIIALAMVLISAAPADAATVSMSGGVATFTAASGEANQLTVYEEAGETVFTEVIEPITAVAPCYEQFGGANCPGAPDTNVNLGDGNDFFEGGPSNDAVQGGTGNDQLFGYGGDDTLDGGDGNDSLDGAENVGGPDGATSLGRDTLAGGPGTDGAGYDARTDPTQLTLDGAANDGASGEGDNVGSDIEQLTGGDGADTIVGNDLANSLAGAAGNDAIRGGGGDDRLDGGGDNDNLSGELGADTVLGGTADDQVDGGPGADALWGDFDACVDCGSQGNDTVMARDGEVDSVGCGLGTDTAVVDATDNVAPFPEACETVDQASIGGDGDDDVDDPATAAACDQAIQKLAKAKKKLKTAKKGVKKAKSPSAEKKAKKKLKKAKAKVKKAKRASAEACG